MNLYRIDFTHYGPKDFQEGTWGFMMARDDAHLYEKLSTGHGPAYWSSSDEELIEVYVDDEETEMAEVSLRDHIIKMRGDWWQEPEDLYYGATQWKWTTAVEHIRGDVGGLDGLFIRNLAKIGMLKETQWEGRKIAVIAAVSKHNYGIGLKGQLPWKLSADLKRFKKLTTGHVVIMGRKTWESIPEKFRPLPNRLNIVLTTQLGYEAKGAEVCRNLVDALLTAPPDLTAFVIGGESLFQEAIPIATDAHITWVDYDGPSDARCFLRFINTWWDEADGERVEADEKNEYRSDYVHYSRKSFTKDPVRRMCEKASG